MKKIKNCLELSEGSRQRCICEGKSELSLEKTNIYRQIWGLGPLNEEEWNPTEKEKIKPQKVQKPDINFISRKPMSSTSNNKPAKPQETLLGDKIGNALKKVGITDEKVSKWLGRPCGCAGRRNKLNRLDVWVRKVLASDEDTKQYLEELEQMLKS